MATESAYPVPAQTLTAGDVRDLRWVRYRHDGAQVDPTPLSVAASMMPVDDDGASTGPSVGAVTVTVEDDPVHAGEKAWLVRIDTDGLDAGRYRWEMTVSGTDPDSRAIDIAPAGGLIVLVDRVPAAVGP